MLTEKQLDYFIKSAAITHAAAMHEAANAAERTKAKEHVAFAAGVQSTIKDLEEAQALGTGHDPNGHSLTVFLEHSRQIQLVLDLLAERHPEVFEVDRTANIAAEIAEKMLGCPRAGSPFHLEGLVP